MRPIVRVACRAPVLFIDRRLAVQCSIHHLPVDLHSGENDDRGLLRRVEEVGVPVRVGVHDREADLSQGERPGDRICGEDADRREDRQHGGRDADRHHTSDGEAG